MAPVDLNVLPDDDEDFEISDDITAEADKNGEEFFNSNHVTAPKRKREDENGREREMKSRLDATKKLQTTPEVATERPNFTLEYAKGRSGTTALPEGWLLCPAMGEPVGQIIPSKTPLGSMFSGVIEPGKRHSPAIILRNQKQRRRTIGLVIDLTNTRRYYGERDWISASEHKVEYIKLPCRGRNEVPDESAVNSFCYEVTRFFKNPGNRDTFVLVHCTHGFNRTGYMIVNYLMRKEAMESKCSPNVAKKIEQFAESRPPGIYKREYIDSLFERYNQKKPLLMNYPDLPEFKRSEETGEDEEEGGPLPSIDPTLGVIPSAERMSNDDILGDAIPEDHQRELQSLVIALLHKENLRYNRFPGSQPVSLDRKNFQLLRQKYYHVTWKADGMRYMILALADSSFLVDRNFRFRRVSLRFPARKRSKSEPPFVHHASLMDGEMVIDFDPEKRTQIRRYLAYDLMVLSGQSLVKMPFWERWEKLHTEVIEPRNMEKYYQQPAWYDYSREVFSVRRKDFWALEDMEKILRNMIPKLSHESDGLIFQAYDDIYVTKTHEGLLKWKYAHMNSVDFLLDKNPHGKNILLVLERGKNTLLEGAEIVFPEGTEEDSLQKKIVECCYLGGNKWEYMRTRFDKATPNALGTYEKVLGSIHDNITEEELISEVSSICKLPVYVEKRLEMDRRQQKKAAQLKANSQH